MRQILSACNVVVRKLKERCCLGDVGTDWRILLKRILNKQQWNVDTGLSSCGQGPVMGA
jgi:hypothetical protein